MTTKAFMSYSHAADGKLAPRFQSALHRFAKPWHRKRAIRIFRDKTSLSVNPHLWTSICRALDDAEYFILMASPEAAASEWVQKEVDYWLQKETADRLLIVLTDGEIHWSQSNSDFDWEKTNALPATMARIFSEEPLYLDLRWARKETDLSLNHPQFREAVSSLSATLRSTSKDELIGADVQYHKRAMRLAWSAAGALLVLMLAASGAAIYANWQRGEALNQRNQAYKQRARAEEQSNIATARQLAAQSQLLYTQEKGALERSVLLAIESYRRSPAYEAAQSLCLTLPLLPKNIAGLDHDDDVSKMAFSTNGEMLATAVIDGTVSIWDVAGKRLMANIGPIPDANAIAVSDDQRCVASAGLYGVGTVWCVDETAGTQDSQWTPMSVLKHNEFADKVIFTRNNKYVAVAPFMYWPDLKSGVQIFEAQSGKLAAQLSSKAGARDMARNPTGTLIAVAGRDSRCRIWDADRGKLVKALSHDGEVIAVGFGHSGKRLVSVTEKGSVYTWRVNDWKKAGRITISTSPKYATISANLQYVATSEGGDSVRAWNRESGKSLFTVEIPGEEISNMVFSPNSRMLAFWGAGGDHVQIWNVYKKKEIARISEYLVNSAVFSPDNAMMATAGRSVYNRVSLWDYATTLAGYQDKYESIVETVRFSSKGTYLAVGAMDGQLHLNDLPANKSRMIDVPDSINSIAFSHDEKYIATGDRQGLVRVWETATGKEAGKFNLDCTAFKDNPSSNWIIWLDWSSNGKYVAAGCSADGATVWDMQANEKVGVLQDTAYMAFHPNQQLLAICGVKGGTRILKSGSWEDVKHLPSDEQLLRGFFSKSGRYFATAGHNGSAVVWRTSDWHRVKVFDHGDQCEIIRFSENERRLATAGGGFVRVWDTQSGNLLGQVKPDVTIHEMRFGPEGKYILTATMEQHVTVWKVANSIPVLRLPHESTVTTFHFSPSFRYIVTGSNDQMARAWYWRPEDLKAEGCDRLARNLTHEEWDTYIGDDKYRKTCPDLPTDLWEWLDFAGESCRSGHQAKAATHFRSLVKAALQTEDAKICNEICWTGSLWGFARIVLPACDQAVDLAGPQYKPYFRDSKGLAQALLGRTDKAITEFQAFVSDKVAREIHADMVSEREKWIEEMKHGKNPFSAELLDSMRKELGSWGSPREIQATR